MTNHEPPAMTTPAIRDFYGNPIKYPGTQQQMRYGDRVVDKRTGRPGVLGANEAWHMPTTFLIKRDGDHYRVVRSWGEIAPELHTHVTNPNPESPQT